MRFGFIRKHMETFEVGVMCDVLEVSRSGYYAWLRRPPSARSQETARRTEVVRQIHAESRGTYGAPRVHAAMQARGETCGKNQVARIMRCNGLSSKRKRRFRATTNSKHKLSMVTFCDGLSFTLYDGLLDSGGRGDGGSK